MSMISGKGDRFVSPNQKRAAVDSISEEAVDRMDQRVRGTQKPPTNPTSAYESGNPDFDADKDVPGARGACTGADIIKNS